METPVFAYTSVSDEALAALQRDVLAVVAEGEPQVTVDVDPLPTLDMAGIRGLITLLRRVREAGGEISLRATRPELRRTLSVTALDKIFSIQTREGAAA